MVLSITCFGVCGKVIDDYTFEMRLQTFCDQGIVDIIAHIKGQLEIKQYIEKLSLTYICFIGSTVNTNILESGTGCKFT